MYGYGSHAFVASAQVLMAAQMIMKPIKPPTKGQLPISLRMMSAARWPLVRDALCLSCQVFCCSLMPQTRPGRPSWMAGGGGMCGQGMP